MSDNNLHEETPYTFLNPEGIPQLLSETELWEYFNQLPDSSKKDELRERLITTVRQSLEQAQQNPLNQPGEVSDILGKFNIVLNRFCKGALLISYSVLTSIMKLKTGHDKPGFDEGEKLITGIGDLWSSISTPDPDAMAIVEAIASWDFENSARLLRECGPSAKEITERLSRNGVDIDGLAGKLEYMTEDDQKILNKFRDGSGVPRYQVRYVRDWMEKILW